MGCWNKTCSLTNLPIYHGDAVYIFMLEKKAKYDQCYATGHYAPVLIPFESEYNDYGGGENSSGIGFKFVLDNIRAKLIEQEVGENKYHDIAVVRSIFGEEQLFESIHEQRLIVKGIMGKDATVNFAMMRKDCVDAILNSWVIQDCKRDPESPGVIYFNYSYDDLADQVGEYARSIKELLDSDRAFMGLDPQGLDDNPKCNNLAKILGFIDYRFSNIVSLPITLFTLLREDKIDEAEAFVKAFLKGVMLNMFFDETRKQWMPGGHEGSQGQEYEPYELLLQVTQETINKRKAEMEEW